MPLSQALLPEFDREMELTRKTLERVPEAQWDWAPHAKSMKMGALATHIAALASWAVATIGQDQLDLAPPGAPPQKPPVTHNGAELLALFDKNAAAARDSIAGASDEQLMRNWSLLMGGKALMTMPRTAVLRGFVISHIIHHRAQLGVYLRLLDLPVPSVYGPSADEGRIGG